MTHPRRPSSLLRPFLLASLRMGSLLIVLLVLSVAASSCTSSDDDVSERVRRAKQAQGKILVGAAWPWEARSEILYRQGMQLALEEINAEGVLGREMDVIRRDDRESAREARLVAQRFAQNPDMVAVIGHLQSSTTQRAARIYDQAGLVHLVPSATSNDLTSADRQYLFRMTFDNQSMGEKLAEFASGQGYERVAIRYVSNQYGLELANAFERHLTGLDATIVSRRSYAETLGAQSQTVRRVVAGMAEENPDVVFLAGEIPIASMIIAQMREVGVTTPVIGSDAMNLPRLHQIGGAAVERTIVPFRYSAKEKRREVVQFRRAFKDRFGVEPDAGAAAAYDALHVLARAMREAETTVPADVARALRSMKQAPGPAGPYAFDDAGNLADQSVRLQVVRDGAFVPVALDAAYANRK